jgi:hypothetical protein
MNRNLIFLVLVILLVMHFLKKSKWTVYGSMGCGWTRKQLKHMDDHRIDYNFVDCDNSNCEHVDAFPTVIKPSGETVVGFTSVA